jgi:amino acid transporter
MQMSPAKRPNASTEQKTPDGGTLDPSAPSQSRPGLRRNYVSHIENVAQTLGVLTPSGTISVIIPLLILTAGNGTWLLLLVTLSIFLLIMLSVVRFASLHACAGSLAAFGQLGFGSFGGLLGGWIYLLGISYCVPAAMLVSASYFDILLPAHMGHVGSAWRLAVLTAALTLLAWLAAHRDIKLSTKVMLIIECCSVGLMLVLMAGGMMKANAWVDRSQFALSGTHFSGFQGGLVLAFMLMAGFEGATSLGEEAQNPCHTIPRAIWSCMLPLTLLYLIMAYCIVSLENRGVISTGANGLTIPFDSIAQSLQRPWMGPLSSMGVALSYFACGLASLTVAARVLFSMAREGRFFVSFGAAHPVNATPHRSIALIALLSIVMPVGMLMSGAGLGFGITFLSQLGSLGLIGGYLFVVVALPRYLRRLELLRRRDVVVCLAASALLLLVVVLSIYPAPPVPYNYVAYVFSTSVAVGVAISFAIKALSNDALHRS